MGIGVYDALTGGSLLYYGSLAASHPIPSGSSLAFPVGALTIELQ